MALKKIKKNQSNQRGPEWRDLVKLVVRGRERRFSASAPSVEASEGQKGHATVAAEHAALHIHHHNSH